MGAHRPLNTNVMDIDLVRRDRADLLRLVVAMWALVPLYADVVLAGFVHSDVAIRLGQLS